MLDSLGVRPDLVVGTSMGALVGALYAGGLSGRQLDSLARELPLEALFRRYAPIALLTAGDFAAPISVLAPAFVLEIRGGVVRLQSPVAREPQINALFNQLLLRANLTAGGDFDRLPRRFRAVATDVRTRSSVVLRDGDLAEAVRASIAIPVVFAPVRRDGQLLVDGGLSANEPIGVARLAGASRVVAVDVGTSMADSIGEATTASMLAYLIDELFTQPPDSLGPDELRIRPDVRAVGPLEFSHTVVAGLIDAGYRAASEALRGCPPSPAPTSSTSPVASDAEASFLADRLARLAEEGVYETVWLRPRRVGTPAAASVTADARFSLLRFAPVATSAPQRIAFGGLSYDGHEGARAWLAAANVAPAGGRVTVGSVLTLGEWRQQLLFTATGVRRHPLPRASEATAGGAPEQVALPDPRSDAPPWSMLVRNLLRPELSLTGSHETVRLYDGRGREQDAPSSRDLFVFPGVVGTPTAGWRLVLGPAAHFWSTHSAALPTDESERGVGALVRGARLFSLPSTGPDLNMVPTVAAEALWLDKYRRLDVQADVRFQLGSLVILRPRAAAGWGESLPLTALFTLGGPHGFPGLRTGERRGDQFAFASLAVLRRVRGPIYARAEVGHGRTALARARRPEMLSAAASGSVSGGELGLTADTPLGPFLIAYGLASTGRSVFKVRLGN
ncbi:MAG: patatin-like phospholipase family protein [Gemmatimonadota bacterium]|nr:patatin-like phospholipase family protein [Gemmatimonadota bacterium]